MNTSTPQAARPAVGRQPVCHARAAHSWVRPGVCRTRADRLVADRPCPAEALRRRRACPAETPRGRMVCPPKAAFPLADACAPEVAADRLNPASSALVDDPRPSRGDDRCAAGPSSCACRTARADPCVRRLDASRDRGAAPPFEGRSRSGPPTAPARASPTACPAQTISSRSRGSPAATAPASAGALPAPQRGTRWVCRRSGWSSKQSEEAQAPFYGEVRT